MRKSAGRARLRRLAFLFAGVIRSAGAASPKCSAPRRRFVQRTKLDDAGRFALCSPFQGVGNCWRSLQASSTVPLDPVSPGHVGQQQGVVAKLLTTGERRGGLEDALARILGKT